MDRVERLLMHAHVDRERGLEVGPLDKPLVKRIDGRQIYYCDYAPREELQRNSSADPEVNVNLTPHIDFVAPRISSDTFRGMTFDYIIASHVIEHIPDVLSWIQTLLQSLTAGGRLILAIPDKRYTFDLVRPVSTVGQVVQAFLEKRTRPTLAQVYDAFSMAMRVDARLCWASQDYAAQSHEPCYTRETALRLARDAFENQTHHDCHCWVFDYESFLRIVDEVREIGILNVRTLSHTPPVRDTNEFHVVLR